MKEKIPLEYEIDDVTNTFKPWETFVALINRDYGENLCKNISNPSGTIEKPTQPQAEPVQPVEITQEARKRRHSKTANQEPPKNPQPIELVSKKVWTRAGFELLVLKELGT